MGLLIKITNGNAATQFGVTSDGVGYTDFATALTETNSSGQITRFRPGYETAVVTLPTGVTVEVGRLADNGRFSVHLSSRHGRT